MKTDGISRGMLGKNILYIESAGFALVILINFLTEVLDFPGRLIGAAETPVNYAEALFEAVVVIAVGIVIIVLSQRLLRRINYLEGFLPVCSFCKKIRADDKWVPIEDYITANSDAVFTHSFCPECGEKHYGKGFGPDADSAED